MLALVTCHIFPPQSDTEKKLIPGTWLPGWQLAVFQSPRLHECGPADAHGNAQPFCMDKCIFRKKRLFCNLATRWNKILQFVPAFPIYGWLTWWCDFFPVGPAFEDHPREFGQKKVQPLDFLMPYIHRLIDQPPLNHNRQKLISCHCTSGSFQEKKSGPFWYDILFLAPYHAPGPSPTVC